MDMDESGFIAQRSKLGGGGASAMDAGDAIVRHASFTRPWSGFESDPTWSFSVAGVDQQRADAGLVLPRLHVQGPMMSTEHDDVTVEKQGT